MSRGHITLELGVLKKNYCCLCGEKLKVRIIILHVKGFYKPFHLSFLKEKPYEYNTIIPVYFCKKCKYYIKYDNQKEIKKMQNEYNCKILSEGKKIIEKFKIEE